MDSFIFPRAIFLRAEQHREGSQYGALISENIREGRIVPSEVTIKLLENAIREALDIPRPGVEGWEGGKGRFLVDGFPRKMDQAQRFDDEVCLSAYVLFLSCTEEVMLARLLERGKTSGREDDNVDSIKKRFKTFEELSMPVVQHYRTLNKVVEVDSTRTIEKVYQDLRQQIDSRFAGASE